MSSYWIGSYDSWQLTYAFDTKAIINGISIKLHHIIFKLCQNHPPPHLTPAPSPTGTIPNMPGAPWRKDLLHSARLPEASKSVLNPVRSCIWGENTVKVSISIDNFEICNKHHKYYPESLNKFCWSYRGHHWGCHVTNLCTALGQCLEHHGNGQVKAII